MRSRNCNSSGVLSETLMSSQSTLNRLCLLIHGEIRTGMQDGVSAAPCHSKHLRGALRSCRSHSLHSSLIMHLETMLGRHQGIEQVAGWMRCD